MRTRKLGLFVLVLLFALACAPAALGAAEEEKRSVTELKFDLGIWTLVVFVLLLLVLGKLAWKPMLEGLKKREENLLNAVEEARKARAEAEKLQAYFQAEMNKAGEKVREILEEARRDAQSTSDEMVAKARADIQTERDRLYRELATARDQALQEIWNQAAQVATVVSAKAIKRELSPSDHRRLVDEALAELQTSGRDVNRDFLGGRA
jgi:F-type H+-transporting ATPase subunit b